VSRSCTQEEQAKEEEDALVAELAASAATKLVQKGPDGSGAEGVSLEAMITTNFLSFLSAMLPTGLQHIITQCSVVHISGIQESVP